jgi:hypothetical protein
VEPAVDVDRPRGGLRVVQVPCATPHVRARPSVTGHLHSASSRAVNYLS